MQAFPDSLLKVYVENNGDLLLSRRVRKIIVNDNSTKGIILEDGSEIKSSFVISNGDCKQTFFDLIGKPNLSKNFRNRFKKLTICNSAFIVYAILNKEITEGINKAATIWYCPTHEVEKNTFVINDIDNDFNKGFFCFFPSFCVKNKPKNKDAITIVTGAEYKSENYWVKNKKNLANRLIMLAENIIPGLSQLIEYREIATPVTLNRYSLNYKGAVHGWESTIAQLRNPFITYKTPIKNLYLVGHWVMQKIGQGGILTSANTGRMVANLIIKKSSK